MAVSLIVTSWNERLIHEKNFPQVIAAARNSANQVTEIILADDCSTDESVSFVTSAYPTVLISRTPRNLGYGANCNQAVSRSSGDLVCILNADVIPHQDFLQASLTHFSDPKVFAVSFNENEHGPAEIVWENGFINYRDCPPPKKVTPTAWASGGSAVFRKSIWQKIGGMDPLFLPFYAEDQDLCLRAARLGYYCLWEPDSRVEHHHESTINTTNFSKTNLRLTKERNHLLLTWRNIDALSLFITHLIGLINRVLHGPGYLKVVGLALYRLLFRPY